MAGGMRRGGRANRLPRCARWPNHRRGSCGCDINHLRPGAREWFWAYLTREHPDLLDAYAELYSGGAYGLKSYASDLARRVAPLLRRHGLDRPTALRSTGPDPRPNRPASPHEPTLF